MASSLTDASLPSGRGYKTNGPGDNFGSQTVQTPGVSPSPYGGNPSTKVGSDASIAFSGGISLGGIVLIVAVIGLAIYLVRK